MSAESVPADLRSRKTSALAAGAAAGLLGEIAGVAGIVVSTIALARHLGPDSFGIYGLSMAAVAPAAWTLASVYGRAALFAGPADALDNAQRLLGTALRWGLVGWGCLALAGAGLAALAMQAELGLALALAGAELPLLAAARVHRGALTATGRYVQPGVASGVFGIARVGAAGMVVFAGAGPVAAVATCVVARMLEVAYCRWKLRLRMTLGVDTRPLTIRGRPFVGAFLLHAICLQTFRRVDLLLLSVLGASGSALGWFAAAQQVALAPALAAGAVVPLASSLFAGANTDASIRAITRRSDAVALTGLVGFLAAAGAMPSLMPLLFGAAYDQSGQLAAWLIVGGAGGWLLALSAARLTAMARSGPVATVVLVMLCLAVSAHLAVIPHHGAFGAAVVTGGAELLAGLVVFGLYRGEQIVRIAVLTGGALVLGGFLAWSGHIALPRALAGLGLPS